MNTLPDRPPAPQSSDVDVWLTRISDVGPDLRRAYEQLLDADETARLARFLVDDARSQFLIARVLLRSVLGGYADVPASSWAFGVNRYGKPYIHSPIAQRDLMFNLSHTGGVVACAVTRGRALGIDIEYNRPGLGYQTLARAAFMQEERTALDLLPQADQARRFYAVWTLKEAYLKAVGTGLSAPLQEFSFDFEHHLPRIRFASHLPDTSANWQFRSTQVTPEHTMALAVAAQSDHYLNVAVRWIVPDPDTRRNGANCRWAVP